MDTPKEEPSSGEGGDVPQQNDSSIEEEDVELDADGTPVVTLKQALEEYEEMEELSTFVLGASDPHNCSYSKGYLKRQALYACLTCNPRTAPFFQTAGVCLACSYKCHDGHDMVELYTKRNFRCDCGNKRFPDTPCVLQKDKEDFNEKNLYSQNFSGLYCTCHRPYPDPEATEEDGMVQCVICEDWYHTQHAIPGVLWSDFESDADKDQSMEMICTGCTQKLEFLTSYGHLQAKPKTAEHSQGKMESTVDNDTSSQDSGIASLKEIDVEKINNTPGDLNINGCPLANKSKTEFKPGCSTVWVGGWRKKLCRCDACKEVYEAAGVTYLLDEDDTIESYEALGKATAESNMVKAEESFKKRVDELGHVGQIEFISGYNDMKEALKDFLNEFAENGKVVGTKDVQEFFENLRAAKRPRLDL